ncbi:hypothetical protein [Jannaschia seohaensis]|uniref:Zinc-binding dehydrogenase n=1 Tax=Jannaschia seohaensis TaxID=475081 RepID=A0A2Y9B5T5_9RHOB|nr:hypothetical protein [Jannaschia seohaensis]PWJ13844.1 hypothetical protein BCF38_11375 [Jannaschia seohaensis]SSA50357.1 hypothetical protein SAMN05421539_11375 [Jannaschia seohaensis]
MVRGDSSGQRSGFGCRAGIHQPACGFSDASALAGQGQNRLLSAAGSSCAEYLGRWAIHQEACRVIGKYRSEVRAERLLRMGIEAIRISDRDTISDAARHSNIVFDAVGGEVASGVLHRMRSDADFVAFGLLSGTPVTVHAESQARYHRFHLRDHLSSMDQEEMRKAYAEIWPWLAVAPPSAPKVFAAKEWREALSEAERPGGCKPVLDMTVLE